MSGELIIIRKFEKTPPGFVRIDVTSHNEAWRQSVSPFYLGPVTLPDGVGSVTMENAWQFSKVYDDMVDSNGNPNARYFEWRNKGIIDNKAHRHPHKGKPLYSWCNGEKLGYIEARKRLYIPMYARAVYANPKGLNLIKQKLAEGYNIALADFDGYNHKKLGMTYEEVINNPHKIMGHGHVLAMMVERPDIIERLINNCGY